MLMQAESVHLCNLKKRKHLIRKALLVESTARPKPRFPAVHNRLQFHEGDETGAGIEVLVSGPVEPFLASPVDSGKRGIDKNVFDLGPFPFSKASP